MKKAKLQSVVTAVLLAALSILFVETIIPLRAANYALCMYGPCKVECRGINCECGRVEETFVECWCDGGIYHFKYCPPQ
jgi:hypothetical protein